MRTDNHISRVRIDEGKMSLIFEYDLISYIYYNKHFTSCNFTNGKEIQIQTPFTTLIDLFPKDQFVLVNQTIIININEIKSIIKQDEKSKIIMKNQKTLLVGMERKTLLSYFQIL